jgi:nitrous oxidase accessory protein NosD
MKRTIVAWAAFSVVVLGTLLGSVGVAFSSTIHVPADQPTIQAGIEAAVNGDTVLVSGGDYFERINFHGKNITVKSTSGPKFTVIDGRHGGSVVTFESGETQNARLEGFTVRNGVSTDGGGILILGGASPSIVRNTISFNTATSGGGIYAIASAPLIQDNTIAGNTASGAGAGLFLENGAAGARIIGNRVMGNTAQHGDGGGIMIRAFGGTLVLNNYIKSNRSEGVFPATHGGGLYLQASSDRVVVIQNVVASNSADQGGGIYLVIEGGHTPLIANNTVFRNEGSQNGSAIHVSGTTSGGRLFNNLFIGRNGEGAVFCDPAFDPNPPYLQTNDSFAARGADYEGSCVGQTGKRGNISVDPEFVDVFAHISGSSAVIDAGSNELQPLPKSDFDGNPRVVDGNDDANAVVDMGAYEFQ